MVAELHKLSEDLLIVDDKGDVSSDELLGEALAAIESVRPGQVYPHGPPPPFVVVVTPQDLLPEHVRTIVQAGGFVCRRPDGFTEALHDDQASAMHLLLGGDWTSDWPDPPAAGNDDRRQGADLSVYEHPPFRLHRDDYARWVERMLEPPERLDD